MTTFIVSCLGFSVTLRAATPEEALAEGLATLRRNGLPIPHRHAQQATVRIAD